MSASSGWYRLAHLALRIARYQPTRHERARVLAIARLCRDEARGWARTEAHASVALLAGGARC